MHRLVSPEGRIGRQTYVLGFALPLVALVLLTWASLTGLCGGLASPVLMAAALGWTLLFAFGDAMNLRRYHDIGRKGQAYRLARPFLVVLPLIAFALNFLIPAQMASAGDLEAIMHLVDQSLAPTLAPIPAALLAVTAAGLLVNVAYLSVTPGETGSNDWGPPPSGPGSSAGGGSFLSSSGRRLDAEPAGGEDDPVARALADYRRPEAEAARATTARAPAAAPAGFGKRRR